MLRDFAFIDVMALLQAARWTLLLSLMAFVGGGIAGAGVTLLRVARSPALRRIGQVYILVVQGTPLLMQMFLLYFGLALAGFDVPPVLAAAAAFTIYASAFFGEIWRGAIESIPKQQWEASASLALTRIEQLRYVIVPQALRISVPPTVGFAAQIVKNTSLAALLGFADLTRVGQLINNVTLQPFPVFGTVAAIYFIICFPLSLLSRRLEGRLHVGRARIARH
jgi:polar amino acid transport system permease protein